MDKFTLQEMQELQLGVMYPIADMMGIKKAIHMKRKDLGTVLFLNQDKHPEAVDALHEKLNEIRSRLPNTVRIEHENGEVVQIKVRPKGEKRRRSKEFGAVAQVHKLCDVNAGKPAKEIFAICVAQGINLNTAKTQYYKWLKERGKKH